MPSILLVQAAAGGWTHVHGWAASSIFVTEKGWGTSWQRDRSLCYRVLELQLITVWGLVSKFTWFDGVVLKLAFNLVAAVHNWTKRLLLSGALLHSIYHDGKA